MKQNLNWHEFSKDFSTLIFDLHKIIRELRPLNKFSEIQEKIDKTLEIEKLLKSKIYYERLKDYWETGKLPKIVNEPNYVKYLYDMGHSPIDNLSDFLKIFCKNGIISGWDISAVEWLIEKQEKEIFEKFEQDFNNAENVAEGLKTAFDNLPENFFK